MNLSYHLLKVHYLLLLGGMVAIAAALGALLTHLFKRHVPITAKRSHNEVVGYIFATVGGLYGLLLGFVVFLVWGAFNTAQSDANREGSLARGLYRDIRYFPDTGAVAPLKRAYVAYVHHVMDTEFPKMSRLEPITAKDRRYFNHVFKELERIDSGDRRIDQMFRHLNELSAYRSLRVLAGSNAIPIQIWLPLLLGAIIVLLTVSVLDIESRRLHIALSASLGAFIGLMFYLIIMLDHPFSGNLRINPDEFRTILSMEAEGD